MKTVVGIPPIAPAAGIDLGVDLAADRIAAEIVGIMNPIDVADAPHADPVLVNAACVSCHTDTLLKVNGNQTHFHNWLPQTAILVAQGQQLVSTGFGGRNRRLRTVDTTITCTSCHLAHKTVDTSNPQLKMVDKTLAQAACDTCHKDAGERPQSIDRLLSGEEG